MTLRNKLPEATPESVDEAINAFLEAQKQPDSTVKPITNGHTNGNTPHTREKSWAEEVRTLADRRREPIERQVG